MKDAQLHVCQLTPPGRGAVGVIGLRGDLSSVDGLLQAMNQRPLSKQPIDRVCYAKWGSESSEDVVVVRTQVDAAEVHCHGGLAAVHRILNDLKQAGATVVSVHDWLAATIGDVATDCQLALARCTTLRTASLVLEQCDRFPAALQQLQSADPEQREELRQSLRQWADFGIHLTTPWQVVLCGRPNVGKSSLINALLGYQRAVVFDQPGTTRDVVEGTTAINGWPVALSDTAGLRETDSSLEAAGISLAREWIAGADLVLFVLDASAGFTAEDQALLNELSQLRDVSRKALPHTQRAPLLVWNKCDVAKAPELGADRVPVSARTGAGLEHLLQRIESSLVPQLPPPGAAYPVTAATASMME